MKAFDLDAALKGAPVVTRDGRPVKIAGYNPDVSPDVRIVGWVDGYCYTWFDNGVHDENIKTSYDLYIAGAQADVPKMYEVLCKIIEHANQFGLPYELYEQAKAALEMEDAE